MRGKKVLVIFVIAIVLIASLGYWFFANRKFNPQPDMGPNGSNAVNVNWQQPYHFNKYGYEPGIAVDSTGALYYTGHKNLDDKTSWDYLASWFFVSTNNGSTWSSPTAPFPTGKLWQTYLGDEGDIAVDSNDFVYFVDTYLVDNHLHVWSNQGNWEYSLKIQKTTGLDDRPWISAQGDGVLHYLGNNAVEIQGGRYWYYRSTNGGRTWERYQPVPGNGWGLVDAERDGDHVYIISEGDTGVAADILLYVSDDQGATWDWTNPVVIAHRDGPGREYPVVSSGPDGQVFALWNDASNGTENGTEVYVGWSPDYGQTWNYTNITPFQGFYDYPTLNIGQDGSLGVAFYATDDLPVSEKSEWYLYGALQRNAINSPLQLNFSRPDPKPCYVGDDLHALHDFFEIVVSPDGALNIAYQYYVGPTNGASVMNFVRGTLPVVNQTVTK